MVFKTTFDESRAERTKDPYSTTLARMSLPGLSNNAKRLGELSSVCACSNFGYSEDKSPWSREKSEDARKAVSDPLRQSP